MSCGDRREARGSRRNSGESLDRRWYGGKVYQIVQEVCGDRALEYRVYEARIAMLVQP